jgi:hypothetical protein
MPAHEHRVHSGCVARKESSFWTVYDPWRTNLGEIHQAARRGHWRGFFRTSTGVRVLMGENLVKLTETMCLMAREREKS